MRRVVGGAVAAVTMVAVLWGASRVHGQSSQCVEIASAVSNPRLASDAAGHVHAVFEGLWKETDTREILYSHSSDGGRTWTAPVDISNTPKVSSDPDVAVESSGAIDVVWRDTTSGELRPDIYFARSADGGHTWSKALDISNTPGVCSSPAIACGPDNSIHVVWVDTSSHNGRPDIFYSVSSDGGKTWSNYDDISPTPGISSEPAIAVGSDGIVHSVWADTSSGEEHPDIYYVKKSAGTWSTPVDVSKSKMVSSHPALRCGAKGRVFLSWTDNSQKVNAADIWCSIATDGGSFAKPLNISDTPGVSSQPAMAADSSGHIGIVWSDTTSGMSKPDIFARVSNDNGDDFSNYFDVSNTPGFSRHPSVAITMSKMIVVWEEVVGSVSSIKAISMNYKGIGTGPVDQVNPTVHRVNR